jgi:hypothetical protein
MGKSIIDLSSVTTIGAHDKIGATAYANLDKKGTLDPKTTLVLCGLAEN